MRSRLSVLIATTVSLTLIGASCSADDPLVVAAGEDAECTFSEIAATGAAHDEEATHDDTDDAEPAHNEEAEDPAAHDETADGEADHDEDATHDDTNDAEPAHDEEAEDPAVHDETADGEADHDEEGTLLVEDAGLAFAIDMVEFAYGCELPPIPSGTIVALQFTNSGVVDHEAVIGDQSVQDEAESAMAEMATSGEAHGHSAPSVTVKPGDTAELVVHLDEPGDLIIGCHIPGHWDAGMHTGLTIAAV